MFASQVRTLSPEHSLWPTSQMASHSPAQRPPVQTSSPVQATGSLQSAQPCKVTQLCAPSSVQREVPGVQRSQSPESSGSSASSGSSLSVPTSLKSPVSGSPSVLVPPSDPHPHAPLSATSKRLARTCRRIHRKRSVFILSSRVVAQMCDDEMILQDAEGAKFSAIREQYQRCQRGLPQNHMRSAMQPQDATIYMVFNPTSAADEGMREVVGELREAGYTICPRATWEEGDGARAVAEAAADNAQLVVACGGDGTLHEVANALMDLEGRRPAMAGLPYGTGNDFLSALGADPKLGAAQLIEWLKTDAWPVDVGRINKHYFLNMATAGVGATITAETSRGFKD